MTKFKELEFKLFNENENGTRYYNRTENAYYLYYIDKIYSNEFETYLKNVFNVTYHSNGIIITK